MKHILMKVSILSILMSIGILGSIQSAEAGTKHPLVGVWSLKFEGDHGTIVCYKILKKNGRYVNIRSTDLDAKHFGVRQYGKFKVGGGWYMERLKYEKGSKFCRKINILMDYEFWDKDTVELSFKINGKKYSEIWYRVTTAPKYEK